ncbi:MAG TPA: exopolysaccharide biosynthesis polyprenyl glycosylphosphotransferase [Candidatus Synoicihabitans sp.]|nr:exopolysaccharide biosynthesis polyprenyl glycosylphosphotransferase [Candidatus Synoicihabitans sp.]
MRSRRIHRLILLGLDALAVLTVFNVTVWMRGFLPWGHVIVGPLLGPFLLLAAALYLIDGYRSGTAMMSLDYTSLHVVAVAAALVGTLLLTFVFAPADYPLQSSRAVIALSFVLLAGITLTYRRSLHRWTEAEANAGAILFLGDRASGEAFRAACAENHLHRPIIFASLDERPARSSAETRSSDNPAFLDVMRAVAARETNLEAIVLRESGAALPTPIADQLMALFFRGVPTFTLELFYETYWRKIPLYRLNHVWLFQEGFEIARDRVFERVKRVTDIATAVLGLVLFMPLLLLAAAAIRLQDGGPALFRQTRVGWRRQPFTLIKLRTMQVGTPADGSARYTLANDPRITPLGRLLRATRLDEVPQLWNVLKGEMSLIGPRAEWTELVAAYERDIPCYHFRHLVRPGITGWAQVNYPYGANLVDTLRKLEYDLYYIRHFSFLIDASIMLKTVHLMLVGKGK